MWGCTVLLVAFFTALKVFPTHVGVYLLVGQGGSAGRLFSPHTWGCTCRPPYRVSLGIVFPTHVGVYRYRKDILQDQVSFPHTRGGVPSGSATVAFAFTVFPTHVGVYRWA